MSRSRPSDLVGELTTLALAAIGGGASSASDELLERLARVHRRELQRLDACMRSTPPWTSEWARLGPRCLAEAKTPWPVAAAATMHASGHVREAALKRLAAAGDARALPFVLLRLNDWVAEVRRSARAALAQYVRPAFAAALVAALPTIQALRGRQRDDHEAVIRWVLGLIAAPDHAEIRLATCRSGDLETRRACFAFGLEIDPADEGLLRLALADPEPGIRTWAVRRLGSALHPALAVVLCQQALGDRSAQVRRVALGELAALVPAHELGPLGEAALLDEAAAPRWQGRYLRARAGPFDFAAFYRNALAAADTPTRTRAALLGLGESGDASDIGRVQPHLEASSVRTRRAAVKAFGQLAPAQLVDPFFAWLCDPLPGVSAVARRALEHRIERVSVDRLLGILAQAESLHVRANVVALGRRLSKWDALSIVLTALDAGTSTVLPSAQRGLESWLAAYNRSFTPPTAGQLSTIMGAVERARLKDVARVALRELLEGARRIWRV